MVKTPLLQVSTRQWSTTNRSENGPNWMPRSNPRITRPDTRQPAADTAILQPDPAVHQSVFGSVATGITR